MLNIQKAFFAEIKKDADFKLADKLCGHHILKAKSQMMQSVFKFS